MEQLILLHTLLVLHGPHVPVDKCDILQADTLVWLKLSGVYSAALEQNHL